MEVQLSEDTSMVSRDIIEPGCAWEEIMVCGVDNPESSCSPREKETILISESMDVSQDEENIENQSISQCGSRKRCLPGDIDSQSVQKKQKLITMTLPVVKIVRSPALELLVCDYKKREEEKELIEGWPGWKYPNPKLKHSQKILQKVIDETEQICRGKVASRQWQARDKQKTQIVSKSSAQNSNFIASLENVLPTHDKTKSLINEKTGDRETKSFNDEKTGEQEKVIDEGTSGFCGYDLDMMVGHFRGWDKPNTKSRDKLKRIVKELDGSISLVSVLDEVYHFMEQCNMTSGNGQLEQNHIKNKEISRDDKEENKVNSIIETHIKALVQSVADTGSLEPRFSYMVLGIMAIMSSAQCSLPFSDIIQYIQKQFPYYLIAEDSWKKALRKTIHFSDNFTKTCSRACQFKKSEDHEGCWTVDPVTAELILGRAVKKETRKTGGNHSFVRTSLSPLPTNSNHNLAEKNILHTSTPIKLLQPLQTPNATCVDRVQRKKIVVKKDVGKMNGQKEMHDKPRDKIHLILKAAENLETQGTIELPDTKKEAWDHKENMAENNDIRVKINKHLKELMKSVTDNISTEPSFSYMVLVVMALESTSQPSLPLHDICQFIKDKFPYYRKGSESWIKIVQRTIDWSDTFTKICLKSCKLKKSHGGCWAIDHVKAEGILGRAVEQARKKKEKEKQSDQVFKTNTPEESSQSDSDAHNEINKSLLSSQETKHAQLSSYARSEDSSNSQLLLKNSSNWSQEIITSELLSDSVSEGSSDSITSEGLPDTTTSQQSLITSQPHIPETNTANMSSTNNHATQSNGCQVIETIVLDSDESNHSTDSSVTETDVSRDSFNELCGAIDYNKYKICRGSTEYQTFYCNECQDIFECTFFMRFHKCSDKAIYPCYLCHTAFNDVDKFCDHLQTSHEGLVNKHDLSPLCWTMKPLVYLQHLKNLNLLSQKKNYLCKFCPALFPFQELLDAHVKFVHY